MSENANSSLVRRSVNGYGFPGVPTATPSADVYETGDEFIVDIDIPGADKSTINLIIQPGLLSVRAKVKSFELTDPVSAHRERATSLYGRQFRLSDGIDVGNARASYEDGVLRVNLPKAAAVKRRDVAVR